MCSAWVVLMSLTSAYPLFVAGPRHCTRFHSDLCPVLLLVLAFWRGEIFMSNDPDVARDSRLKIAAQIPFGLDGRPSSPGPQIGTPSGFSQDTVTVHGHNMQFAEDPEKGGDDAVDKYYARQRQYDVERPALAARIGISESAS